jgi:tryptophan synthase alpha chain
MSIIERTLRHNRENGQRSLMVYLNGGDPSLELTSKLIKQCAAGGADIIELGVPFPNSFTDGTTVLNSHKRALKNEVDFEDVISLIKDVRTDCDIPIVLLADFSHSVKPRGIEYIVEQCCLSGVEGLLLHGLPPLYLDEYLKQTEKFGIDPIFSLYPNTSQEKMAEILGIAKGFIYLVSKYGRTGVPIDFLSPKITNFYSSVSAMAELPIMAGFGIKNVNDMEDIFSAPAIDGVIIGSAICNIIETSPDCTDDIINKVNNYLKVISVAKNTGYEKNKNTRLNSELTT